jgi:proline dehydrogenase
MEKERARASKMAYPSPIQPDKLSTDKDYNNALGFCIDHIDRISVCAGSHNEQSSMFLTELMAQKSLANNDQRIYFSQLFGMSDHISFNLSSAGYNVAKYLPYGPVKAVMPYLFRRAAENTSVKGQAGRELTLISREVARRKKA